MTIASSTAPGRAAPPSAAGATGSVHRLERTVAVAATPMDVFALLDDPRRLAAHMARRSWRLGFGRLAIAALQDPAGRSGFAWRGRVFGLPIAVDEVVTEREPTQRKAWVTIGAPRLWVLAWYRMGFAIQPASRGSSVTLWIEYTLPARGVERLLGRVLGHAYARWCVDRSTADLQRALGPTS